MRVLVILASFQIIEPSRLHDLMLYILAEKKATSSCLRTQHAACAFAVLRYNPNNVARNVCYIAIAIATWKHVSGAILHHGLNLWKPNP